LETGSILPAQNFFSSVFRGGLPVFSRGLFGYFQFELGRGGLSCQPSSSSDAIVVPRLLLLILLLILLLLLLFFRAAHPGRAVVVIILALALALSPRG